MKKYSDYAHFNDSVEYNGYYFFSERLFNGLFRVKKGKLRAEFISNFPNENLFQEDIHGASLIYDDAIYFIPLKGNGITIYYPNNNKFEIIELENSKRMRSQFISYIVMNDGVLLIPQFRDRCFAFLNLKQKRVERVGWLDCLINEEVTRVFSDYSWETFSANCAYVYKSIVYLALSDTNTLLAIDFETKRLQTIIAPYDVHIRSITGSNDVIWVTVAENLIISYDLSKAGWSAIDIPFVSYDKKYPYLVAYEIHNDLIIIPGRDDKLLHYHNDEWENIAFPECYTRNEEKCLLTMRCSVFGSKIYMYPRAASGVLVYDYYSGIMELFEIRYEQSFIRKLKGKQSREYMKNSQLIESVDYALGDYLFGIVYGSSNEGENLINE